MDFIYDPGLVLYLPLYSPDGGSFKSRDAYGHPGTVTGAVWCPQGRYFDGSDDEIVIPHHANLSLTGSITIQAWIKLSIIDSGYILSKIAPGHYNYDFLFESANKRILFELYDGTNDPMAYSKNNSVAEAGQWYFVEGVLRKGINAQVFVNSVGGTAVSDATTVGVANSSNVKVGNRSAISNNYFNGVIGEILVFNRALTPLERQRIYESTRWRYQ